MRKTLLILTLTAGISSAQAEQARTIHYATNEIAALRAKVRFTTVLVLPTEERILDYVVGDRDNWVIEGAENLCYLKPSKEGAVTNLSLVTAAGPRFAVVAGTRTVTLRVIPSRFTYMPANYSIFDEEPTKRGSVWGARQGLELRDAQGSVARVPA